MRWAALLRGVNVGGARKLPMAELSALLAAQGCREVRTLLASGNSVFEGEGSAAEWEVRLGAAAREALGLETEWLLRSSEEMAAVLAACPFPDAAEARPSQLHVVFHREPFPAGLLPLVHGGPERLAAVGRELFIDYPDGAERSALGPAMARARFPRIATARNWNTVVKLAAMLNN